MVLRSRDNNYDLLRIVSSIAIVALHVSASYLDSSTNANVFGKAYTYGLFWSSFYNVFSRFAVPCFIMLAGAFALSEAKNKNYADYYIKVFRKIYIPTFIFSALYVAYSILLVVLSNAIGGSENILAPISDAIRGVPFSHLWYLYMMIGVYLLVPVIIRIRESVSRKNYIIAATILMIASSIGFMFSTNPIKWEPGFSVRFVAYFMFGDIIRSAITSNKKSNRKALLCILFSCLIFSLVTYLRVSQAHAGISDENLTIKLIDPLCPWIIVASMSLFLGFSYLNVKRDLSKTASLTFYVYLMHAGVWSVFFLALKRIGASWNNAVVIPIAIIIVYAISFTLAKTILVFLNRKNS